MKVGIDARMYGVEHGGIGRYVKNLITELLKLPHDTQYTLFVSPKQLSKLAFQKAKLVPVRARHYTLGEQIEFPLKAMSAQLDILHLPHFNIPVLYPGPMVSTIHDILWHHQKGKDVTTLNNWQYWFKYLGYRVVTHEAVRRSKRILVPSAWVSDQLIKQFKRSDLNSKIVITPEAVDPELLALKSNLNKLLKLPQKVPYVIYVGSCYPHKNVTLLVETLVQFNQSQKLNLVIASSRSAFLTQTKRLVQKLKAKNIIHFIDQSSDAELKALIQGALALIQPSLSEGFGLTGLEAMALGTPVISSSAPALPEVYGSSALYFNPTSSEDLISKLDILLHQSQTRKQLIKKGSKHFRRFSWAKLAQSTHQAYLDALSR